MWLCQIPADYVAFTEEILNGKLHFHCSVIWQYCIYVVKYADNKTKS